MQPKEQVALMGLNLSFSLRGNQPSLIQSWGKEYLQTSHFSVWFWPIPTPNGRSLKLKGKEITTDSFDRVNLAFWNFYLIVQSEKNTIETISSFQHLCPYLLFPYSFMNSYLRFAYDCDTAK